MGTTLGAESAATGDIVGILELRALFDGGAPCGVTLAHDGDLYPPDNPAHASGAGMTRSRTIALALGHPPETRADHR